MQHLHFHPEKGVVMVKQGFSWPAAIFGSLWAMAHHMWFPYVLLLLPIEGLTCRPIRAIRCCWPWA